jgi:hypothetical protein
MRARSTAVYQKLASLPAWLRGLIHDWRWWKATILAAGMWGAGWYLVILWTSHLGHPWSGRTLVSAAMIWPTYRIHRWIWKDRLQQQQKVGFRWSKTWAKLYCLHAAVYWVVVNLAGVQYLKAGMAMTIPFAILAYYMRDEKDFAPELARQTE